MTASEALIRYPVLLAIVAIVNIPICLGIATSFFDDGDEIKLMLKNMFLSRWLVSNEEAREASWPTAKLLVLLIVLGLLIVSEYSFLADRFPAAGTWAQGLIGK